MQRLSGLCRVHRTLRDIQSILAAAGWVGKFADPSACWLFAATIARWRNARRTELIGGLMSCGGFSGLIADVNGPIWPYGIATKPIVVRISPIPTVAISPESTSETADAKAAATRAETVATFCAASTRIRGAPQGNDD